MNEALEARLRVFCLYMMDMCVRLGPYLPVLIMTCSVMAVTLRWYVLRRPIIEEQCANFFLLCFHAHCSQSDEDRTRVKRHARVPVVLSGERGV